jgi:multidrug efflux pump subunit AcrA (membrane-fusion protein)
MNATVSFLSPKKLAATRSLATSAEERPALRVPASAVRDGAVFVVENGKAVRRTVITMQTASGHDVEIRKGLIGGEDLILSPPQSLQDGAAVRVEESKS